jgi:hypothetical protein
MTPETPRRCLDLCSRARIPGYSRCDGHLRQLLARIFGPAEWRV